MAKDSYKQSGDLVMRICDAKWQAAIDGDAELHNRQQRVFDKPLNRHGRRERLVPPQRIDASPPQATWQ